MFGIVSVHFRQDATLAQAGQEVPILLSRPSKFWKPRSVLCARSLRRFTAPPRLAHSQLSREKADACHCSQGYILGDQISILEGLHSFIISELFSVFYICENLYRVIRNLRNSRVDGITQA